MNLAEGINMLSLIRLGGYSASRLLRSIVLYGVVGLALNWAFLIWLYSAERNSERATFGFSDSVLSVAATLMLGLFFPFVYIWSSRLHGFKSALLYLYKKHRVQFYEVFTNVFLKFKKESEETSETKKETQENLNYHGLKRHLTRLEKIPKPLKFLFGYLLDRLPLAKLVKDVLKDEQVNQQNERHAQAVLTDRFDAYITKKLLAPSLGWFWILLIFNLVLMALFYYLVIVAAA